MALVPLQSGRAHGDALPVQALPGTMKTSHKSRGNFFFMLSEIGPGFCEN